MKVVTANRLTDGEAVWLRRDHSWCTCIDEAALCETMQEIEVLQRAGTAALLKNEVIDVDLVDVDVENGAILPKRLRERIRAAGPTNRRDLGKQAAKELSRQAA